MVAVGEYPDSYGPARPAGGTFEDESRMSGDGHRGVKGIRNGSWCTGALSCRNWNRSQDMVACLDLERGDGRSVSGRGGEDKDWLLK